jgi:hypothetical protein
MARQRGRLAEVLRRWRVARAEKRAVARSLQEQREVDHLERIREGIKDVRGSGGW